MTIGIAEDARETELGSTFRSAIVTNRRRPSGPEMIHGDFLDASDGLLIAACVGLTMTLRFTVSGFFASKIGRRLLPLVPLSIGLLGAGAGLVQGSSAVERCVRGLLLGALAAHAFKATRTTVLGLGLPSRPSLPELPIGLNRRRR